MTPALVAACLWALAASLLALLPMRRQIVPGLVLLCAAPPLLVWIALTVSPWWVVAALLALVSMFRHPLLYLVRRLVGAPAAGPRPPGGPGAAGGPEEGAG